MSSNNIIIITPVKSHTVVDQWEAVDIDVEGGDQNPIFTANSVEEAVRKAEEYMKENTVEYGYRLCFPKE